MHRIEKKHYGFKLTFGDIIDENEMSRWVYESEITLQEVNEKFGVIVDMRTLHPLSVGSLIQMHIGQKLYRAKGMERSAVIVTNPKTAQQFVSIAKKTGIHNWERYISTILYPDWEKVALDWIEKSIEPEE